MAGANDGSNSRKVSRRLARRLRGELGLSESFISNMTDTQMAWFENKLEVPDRPRARLEYEHDALTNDSGVMPPEGRSRALEQLAQARAAVGRISTEIAGVPTGSSLFSVDARVEGPTAGLTANAGWTAHGPGNIGGRTRAIVVHPANSARLYAASVGGGVWRSTDSGASWIPLDDHMANLAVCSLVIDPTDPNRLYAGTGEGFSNVDAIRGDGIFTSSDGGQTWTQMPSTAGTADFHYVNSLALSSNAQTMLAGTTSGIFRSTDGGVTWTQASTVGISNLAIDPADSSKAVAGGLTGGRAYFSTDGGASWTAATRPTTNGGRAQVCYAAADTSTVYASVDASTSQLWRSTDGGQTYTQRNATSGGQAANFLGGQGWYDNAIWAGDPTNANLVILGGVDLWRSTNGGNTLTQISTWWDASSAHADHHVIVTDPGFDGAGNKRVYFGNDGGFYRTDDVTTVGNNASEPFTNGWVNLNNGYGVTQFYYGDGHVATNTIVAGAQDNGTLRYTPSQGVNGWNSVWGGDGGDVASDPSDPQIWYGEYVYLQLFRDATGGAGGDFPDGYICGRYWDNGWKWKPAPFTITEARDQQALFIAPFELDPNEPNRLLGGGLSLWRTNDAKAPNSINPPGGPSWATIKDPIGSNRRTHSISAIAIAHGNPDVIAVGHGEGSVYRTTNGTSATPTWTQVDTNGIGADRQCLSVTIDPNDHNLIYASFGGYQSDNLWRTTDGGQSWTNISGGLPAAPIRDLTIHPQRSTWIYVATEVGVFASEDGGATWSPTNEGPANVACRDLFWLGCRLVCVTHGRGTFEIDLPIANAFPAPVLAFTGAENYTVQGNSFTRYKLSVTNRAAFPNSLFYASPDLPPCGLNANSARTWVDIHNADDDQRLYGFCALDSSDALDKLWFAVPQGSAPPSSVYVVLRDRRCGASFTSNDVALGGTTTRVKVLDDGPTRKFTDDVPTRKFTDDGPQTRNKFVDDIRTPNKFSDDGPQTRIKFLDDGSRTANKFLDDGPQTRIKFLDDRPGAGTPNKAFDDRKSPGLDPRPPTRSASLNLPFALATPHHAPPDVVAAAGGVSDTDVEQLLAAITELDDYVFELGAAIEQGAMGYDIAALYDEYESASSELQGALEVYWELAGRETR